MAAVRYKVSSSENSTGAQQHQRTKADVIATLALGPGPGIAGCVVELGGVAGELIPIHQYVTLRKQYGCATGAAAVVHDPVELHWPVKES